MHSPSAQKKGCACQHRAETTHLQLRIERAFFFLYTMALTSVLRHYSGSQNAIGHRYQTTKHFFEKTTLQIPWWFVSFHYLLNTNVEEFTTYLFTHHLKVGHKTQGTFRQTITKRNKVGSKKNPLLFLHTKFKKMHGKHDRRNLTSVDHSASGLL